MELMSQKMRKLAPELDPLRIGTGWKPEDLEKIQYCEDMNLTELIFMTDKKVLT